MKIIQLMEIVLIFCTVNLSLTKNKNKHLDKIWSKCCQKRKKQNIQMIQKCLCLIDAPSCTNTPPRNDNKKRADDSSKRHNTDIRRIDENDHNRYPQRNRATRNANRNRKRVGYTDNEQGATGRSRKSDTDRKSTNNATEVSERTLELKVWCKKQQQRCTCEENRPSYCKRVCPKSNNKNITSVSDFDSPHVNISKTINKNKMTTSQAILSSTESITFSSRQIPESPEYTTFTTRRIPESSESITFTSGRESTIFTSRPVPANSESMPVVTSLTTLTPHGTSYFVPEKNHSNHDSPIHASSTDSNLDELRKDVERHTTNLFNQTLQQFHEFQNSSNSPVLLNNKNKHDIINSDLDDVVDSDSDSNLSPKGTSFITMPYTTYKSLTDTSFSSEDFSKTTQTIFNQSEDTVIFTTHATSEQTEKQSMTSSQSTSLPSTIMSKSDDSPKLHKTERLDATEDELPHIRDDDFTWVTITGVIAAVLIVVALCLCLWFCILPKRTRSKHDRKLSRLRKIAVVTERPSNTDDITSQRNSAESVFTSGGRQVADSNL